MNPYYPPPRRRSGVLTFVVVTLVIALALGIGAYFLKLGPWSKGDEVVFKGGNGIVVTTHEGMLESEAKVTITPKPAGARPEWPAAPQALLAAEIEPTKGQLDGEAVISFPHPKGVPSEELMVVAFNPTLNAWLPTDFAVDNQASKIMVLTNHFSSWEVRKIDPELYNSVEQLGTTALTDTVKYKSPIGGFLNRLYPTIPDAQCKALSPRLQLKVIDAGTPNKKPACTEATNDANKVVVRLTNTHYYPARIDLPKGVKVKDGELTDAEGFVEVMSQMVARHTSGSNPLLRSGHTVALEVDLKEIADDAKIYLKVDPTMLVTDMGLWLTDLAIGQKGAKWEAMRQFKDINASADLIANCAKQVTEGWQHNQEILDKLESKDDKQQVEGQKLVLEAVKKCAEPTAKEAGNFLSRAWGKAKPSLEKSFERFRVISPLGRTVSRLNTLWQNPQMITAWTEGVIASLFPANASRVTVELHKVEPLSDGVHEAKISIGSAPGLLNLEEIQFFWGDEAKQACIEDGHEPSTEQEFCSDYYVRYPKIYRMDVPASPESTVLMHFDGDNYLETPTTDPTALDRWLLGEKHSLNQWKLTVKDGVVIRFEQIFTP